MLAAVCAIALLAVGVAVLSERDGPGSPAVQRAVQARLPALQAFVQRARGLPFLRPVQVEVLDDRAFVSALQEPSEQEAEAAGDGEATLRALGLLTQDEDLDAALADSLADAVAGFYDPEDGRLVVRGTAFHPFVEMVLVHELTHALQDQHFDLSRPDLQGADDERQIAFDALVEGDATRVEQAWLQEQPADVQRAVGRELERRYGDAEPGPRAVEALLGYPYFAGPELVRQLLEQGGQPRLDEAFRTPPTTTEQVRVLGPGALVVPRPDDLPAGEVVDEGVLGEFGLVLLLSRATDELAEAPDGWDGDRYATVDTADGPCTVVDVALDRPTDRDELAELLRRTYRDVQPRGATGLRLASCIS